MCLCLSVAPTVQRARGDSFLCAAQLPVAPNPLQSRTHGFYRGRAVRYHVCARSPQDQAAAPPPHSPLPPSRLTVIGQRLLSFYLLSSIIMCTCISLAVWPLESLILIKIMSRSIDKNEMLKVMKKVTNNAKLAGAVSYLLTAVGASAPHHVKMPIDPSQMTD